MTPVLLVLQMSLESAQETEYSCVNITDIQQCSTRGQAHTDTVPGGQYLTRALRQTLGVASLLPGYGTPLGKGE
jgi:hypothetical protein